MLLLPWGKPARGLLRNLIGWQYFSPFIKVLSLVDSKPNFVMSTDCKPDSRDRETETEDIYSDLYINSDI